MPLPIPGLDHLSDDTIFNFCCYVACLPWLVLLFAPKWNMRPTIVHMAVLIQCVIYVPTFAASFSSGEGSALSTFAEFGTLEGVTKLFGNAAVILPAWVHYLAFDLVVGNSLVEKNNANPAGLPQAVMIPVVLITSLSGPAGFLLHSILQAGFSLVGTKGTTKAA